jgi:hypothetical protein
MLSMPHKRSITFSPSMDWLPIHGLTSEHVHIVGMNGICPTYITISFWFTPTPPISIFGGVRNFTSVVKRRDLQQVYECLIS